ncbi:MAG TPA: hypothetical protein VL175_08725 [Pirellulales bacterium]|nr:hypothetical protein [Pirellulales bacterium]
MISRKRLLIDHKLQRAILIRSAIYWIACLVVASLILVAWDAFEDPGRPVVDYFRLDRLWANHQMVLVGAVLMLPFVLFDVLQITNRVAGPIYRLRASIRALAAGEHVQPIQFRGSDFWHEVGQEFNQLIAYAERLKAEQPEEEPEETLEFERVGDSTFELLHRR